MTEIKTIAYDTAKELCIKPTSQYLCPWKGIQWIWRCFEINS